MNFEQINNPETRQEFSLNEEDFLPFDEQAYRKKFETQYEEDPDNIELKEILAASGKLDLYIRKKDKYIQLQIEILESRINEVMDIEERKWLFKNMDTQLAKFFNVDDFNEKSGEETLAIILNHNDVNKYGDQLHVVMGDVSFLSLANKEGHANGDELLKNVGSASKEAKLRAYRHGGDEVSGLCFGEVEEKLKNFKKLFSQCKKIHGLEPNIDTGTASLLEALAVFRQLYNNGDEQTQNILSQSSLKKLEDMWVELADARAFMQKTKDRILLLMDMRHFNIKEYSEVIGSLRKGADDMSDDEIDTLIEKYQDKQGEDLSELKIDIFKYIQQKEDIKIQKMAKELEENNHNIEEEFKLLKKKTITKMVLTAAF